MGEMGSGDVLLQEDCWHWDLSVAVRQTFLDLFLI